MYILYREDLKKTPNNKARHDTTNKQTHKQINKTNNDFFGAYIPLYQIQEEIATLRKSGGGEMNTPAVNSLSQWFSHYGGNPNATSAPEGFLTSFSASSKVYGGTNHHPG